MVTFLPLAFVHAVPSPKLLSPKLTALYSFPPLSQALVFPPQSGPVGEGWGWSVLAVHFTDKSSVKEGRRLAQLFPLEATSWDLVPGPSLGLFSAGPEVTGLL